ncbi:MAG: hypothetical protein CMD43_01175 [Gammaproteobacteria bacterium]|jgi:hypothetical protein|nr:hypothetical protein [Gammaproteobacteria bacterium]
MNRIMNDLFDIIISLVKLGVDYGRDLWDSISMIWKENHLTPPKQEEDFIWNGGVTNEGGSRIDDSNDEHTQTPYDDIITYDGVMDEIEE